MISKVCASPGNLSTERRGSFLSIGSPRPCRFRKSKTKWSNISRGTCVLSSNSWRTRYLVSCVCLAAPCRVRGLSSPSPLDRAVALLLSRLAWLGVWHAHQLLHENMFPTLPDTQVENSAVKGARSHMGMHSPWGSSNANHR